MANFLDDAQQFAQAQAETAIGLRHQDGRPPGFGSRPPDAAIEPGEASRSARTRAGPPRSVRSDFALSRNASAVVAASVGMGILRRQA